MRRHRVLRFLAATTLAAATLAPPAAIAAGGVLDRIAASGRVRVCIWPDYYGITLRNPRNGALQGIDIDLAGELAHDLRVKVEFVTSSFVTLIDDLNGDRCDVAMFGVGMLPARIAALRFTQPYLQSDIYGVTTRSSRVVRQWSDIDRADVKVAVQAATFMEPVMRNALKSAQLVIVRPPATREQELESGRVDVFMTDYPYSRRLLDSADWARLVPPPTPFHVLQYGYPVKPGDDAWFQRMSAFVASIKSDGRLEAAARRHGLQDIVVRR